MPKGSERDSVTNERNDKPRVSKRIKKQFTASGESGNTNAKICHKNRPSRQVACGDVFGASRQCS